MCYQWLPESCDFLLGTPNHSIILVVSPLIAVLKDQVSHVVSKLHNNNNSYKVLSCINRGLKAGYMYMCGEDDDYVQDFINGTLLFHS